MNEHTDDRAISRSMAQRIAPILAVILQIGATFLPNLGIGESIGSQSDSVRTLITPAGWAFAIWGPLFFGSALFAIYQALPSHKTNRLFQRIAWPASGAFAANGLWAMYTQLNDLDAISVIIIAGGLFCALLTVRAFSRIDRELAKSERWLAALPLSGLAAWLTAATIVNISAALTYYGVGGNYSHPGVAAAVVLVGGIIAALAVSRERANPVYALVFLWALAAIYFDGGQREAIVGYAAIGSAILVIVAFAITIRRPENRRRWFG